MPCAAWTLNVFRETIQLLSYDADIRTQRGGLLHVCSPGAHSTSETRSPPLMGDAEIKTNSVQGTLRDHFVIFHDWNPVCLSQFLYISYCSGRWISHPCEFVWRVARCCVLGTGEEGVHPSVGPNYAVMQILNDTVQIPCFSSPALLAEHSCPLSCSVSVTSIFHFPDIFFPQFCHYKAELSFKIEEGARSILV
jgi:hypothetical protein